MTRITTTPLAVSADYRDALVVARRAKNWLFLLLLLFLLTQITLFFLAKYTDVVRIGPGGTATVKTPTSVDVDADADVDAPTTGTSPATAPGATPPESTTPPADTAATGPESTTPPTGTITPESTTPPAGTTTPESTTPETTTPPAGTTTTPDGASPTAPPSLMALAQAGGGADVDLSARVGTDDKTTTVLAWLVNSMVYLATIFSILLALVILLIVLIMLVGRFEGTAPSTSAFVWAALLALLLFPWQLCYGPETSPPAAPATSASASSSSAYDQALNDFRVPGVMYTWGELRRDVNFPGQPTGNAVLKWARFAGFPFLALLILFAVQAKSGRAVKVALGEADVHVDVATTDV